MKLAATIAANIERIAADWEHFAATLVQGREHNTSILRDDIVEILQEIITDMALPQNKDQQRAKSEGNGTTTRTFDETVARHTRARLKMGLSSQQFMAEFRALRATVTRLWQDASPIIDHSSLNDLIRFNEALDRVLSDAAVRYTEEIDRSRDTFLGILGHDLRNPLAAIAGSAELQLKTKTPERYQFLASQISISATRISHMITDLIKLTRLRLGTGIAIRRALTSVRGICERGIDEMKAIYPNRDFRLICPNNVSGDWDEPRISQVLSNLLGNAAQHGAEDTPIVVTTETIGNALDLAVQNTGPAIPAEKIPKLFDKFVQYSANERAADDASHSLGLGLYIAREIVRAHGGSIDVRSSDTDGTTFTVHLPLSG